MVSYSPLQKIELTDSKVKIMDIVKKYNLFLLEDGCDCLGATWGNKLLGTFGDMSSISFYPAHHMTMGEGGMTIINNRFLKKTASNVSS